MLELLLALAFGIALGVICGLLPGLHPNNAIPIILGLSFLFPPLSAAIVLISAGIVNGFVAFIPSILVGAPESGNELSVLPGHRLLLQGRGYEALRLTVIGGLASVLFAMLTLPIFVIAVPKIYSLIRPNVHFLLIFVAVYMIFSEKGIKEKLFAAVIFALSGALGHIILDIMQSGNEILFPLLSGLFGLPMLLLAIKNRAALPETFSLECGRLRKREIIKPAIIGSLAGMVAGLLPGIGSSQATVLAQAKNERTFLMAMAGVSVVDMVYSILALWLIGNPRSGIAVAVGTLVNVDMNTVLVFLSVIMAAAGAGAFLALKLSRAAVFAIRKFDYQRLCLHTFAFICVLIFAFSGIFGLAVAGIALSIGLAANLANIRKSHAMGCLILPTVLFFAGFA